MSQAMASSHPPPNANPLTAAMIGLGSFSGASKMPNALVMWN